MNVFCLLSLFGLNCPSFPIMKDVVRLMGNQEFFVEVKYDGERMQLHKDGDKFKFYSRNGFDFTDDFGQSPRDPGKFVSFISRSLRPSVKNVILDGEICAFNRELGVVAQKGEQMNIRTLGDTNHPVFQQCLYAYDVVYLNGKVLTNQPLTHRLEVLSSIIQEIPGRVQFADRKKASTTADVIHALNDAIDRREEGLVVKDPTSVYKPNVRTKGGWIKIKPEYTNSLVDQCDLIIMGGYYGSGRRGGGTISHFLLGLASRSENEQPREIHSFCRVGSGYSMKELADMMQKLRPHFRDYRRGMQPSFSGIRLELGREKPDVIIDPKKSVLLQVKAAEIIASDIYKTGYTLR